MKNKGPVAEWLQKNADALLTRENILLGRVKVFKAPEAANLSCVECAVSPLKCRGKTGDAGFQKCFRVDLDTDE